MLGQDTPIRVAAFSLADALNHHLEKQAEMVYRRVIAMASDLLSAPYRLDLPVEDLLNEAKSFQTKTSLWYVAFRATDLVNLLVCRYGNGQGENMVLQNAASELYRKLTGWRGNRPPKVTAQAVIFEVDCAQDSFPKNGFEYCYRDRESLVEIGHLLQIFAGWAELPDGVQWKNCLREVATGTFDGKTISAGMRCVMPGLEVRLHKQKVKFLFGHAVARSLQTFFALFAHEAAA